MPNPFQKPLPISPLAEVPLRQGGQGLGAQADRRDAGIAGT
jgi:hypothetical protein